MKTAAKKRRLQARIKHWETSYTNEADVRSHKKPGSQKR